MSKFRTIIIALFAIHTLFQTYVAKADSKPINLLPMYGGTEVVKTDFEKHADEKFIAVMTKNGVSRDSAAVISWMMGMNALQDRDSDTAMKRFNQSWLLDQACYLPYWGFGKIMMTRMNIKESLEYFERSLAMLRAKPLPSMKKTQPVLFFDAARAYSMASLVDTLKTSLHRKRADVLFTQSLEQDPKFREGYMAWLAFTLISREYQKAWEIVHDARRAGVQDFSKDLLKELSEKMPEPRK
ncbi:MAG: hypothetical protein JZU65_11080 [Chlorobium sp.]|jgi:hypothetical protein|nr:hypothetical protein [Chlorobium sp.]